MGNQQNTDNIDIPVTVLALRVTIELFRVLCGDTRRLSINTLIKYVNKVENFPLTFPQLLQVLCMFTEQTFQPYDLQNYRNPKAAARGDDHLKLRTYELLDFIKQFAAKIQTALTELGVRFVNT